MRTGYPLLLGQSLVDFSTKSLHHSTSSSAVSYFLDAAAARVQLETRDSRSETRDSSCWRLSFSRAGFEQLSFSRTFFRTLSWRSSFGQALVELLSSSFFRTDCLSLEFRVLGRLQTYCGGEGNAARFFAAKYSV